MSVSRPSSISNHYHITVNSINLMSPVCRGVRQNCKVPGWNEFISTLHVTHFTRRVIQQFHAKTNIHQT